MAAPAALPWTGDADADRLLAQDATALLIGFALDQQVTVQKAFAGPAVLRERLGHLDPARIAALDADAFLAVCRTTPAIHRFPSTMATRVQDLCATIATTYGGDAARIWTEAADGPDLAARLGALPGIGPMKVQTIMALLARQYGVELPGMQALLPAQRTLGDVTSADELADYQAQKRAAKAAKRRASS